MFAVIREAGPGWRGGGISAQPGVNEHAAFMNGLAASGFVLLAGPVGGSEHGRLRVLLIVDAEDQREVERRLAGDPWAEAGILATATIESWNIVAGTDRLRAPVPG